MLESTFVRSIGEFFKKLGESKIAILISNVFNSKIEKLTESKI